MNKVILLVLLMPLPAFGQIFENFEQGPAISWTQCPEGHWSTENTNSISGSLSFHHSFDNSASATDYAGFSTGNLHPGDAETRWSFSIRHGCEPSSSNNWGVYLLSDEGPEALYAGSGGSGYAVGVNLSGYDDTLRLWKIIGGSFYQVITTGINWQLSIGSGTAVTITVTRSVAGEWTLEVHSLTGSLMGSYAATDAELFRSAWFVISYKYTSTRDRLLWIDNVGITGEFYEDIEPPSVRSCRVTDENTIEVIFSENVDDTWLQPSNFTIPETDNNALTVTSLSGETVMVKFAKKFTNKITITLVIIHLCDEINNCTGPVTVTITPGLALPGDVVITEIMADPVPPVSLPGKEFLEITNMTGLPVNVKQWQLTDGNQYYIFPDRVLQPVIPAIVCHERDTGLFRIYGKTIGLRAFPALTDGGKVIVLNNNSGTMIHGIEYSGNWYGDELKSGGGWSLEMIDASYPFYQKGNWQASASKEGGTPGNINSVSRTNPDMEFSGIENVFAGDSVNVHIRFSETVRLPDPGDGVLLLDGQEVSDVISCDPIMRAFTIVPAGRLVSGRIYTFTSGGVTDFAGNTPERSEFRFGIAEQAGTGDLLFNELLFNPVPGYPDFIEIFNSSEKIIDASRILLASVSGQTGDTSGVTALSQEKRCIMPGDYYVVTTERELLLEQFPGSDKWQVFEIPSLPSMPDDKGHLLLFNRELELLDEVSYDESMQYSLLQTAEGVSLEKIRPDAVSSERSYWHSASEACGWGTPGKINSVFSGEPSMGDVILFSTDAVSPDNDGSDDILIIDLALQGNGNVVSVMVFDESGNLVKKPADNFLAGQNATIVWDATAGDGTLVSQGIYVFLITVFDDEGKVKRWKRVCAVLR